MLTLAIVLLRILCIPTSLLDSTEGARKPNPLLMRY